MSNAETMIQAAVRQSGGTLSYHYQPWNGKYVFQNERGEQLELERELAALSEQDFLRKIINFILKDIPLKLEAGTSTTGKRLQEINDELDILRGIRPTPDGYQVDIAKVKVLMTELAGLTGEKANE